jgi:predicted nucleotidyltransferase
MSLIQLAHEKRDDIIKIAADHGASNVRILVSKIEGSDGIDFLVDFDVNRGFFDLCGLSIDLEELLDPGSWERYEASSFLTIPKVNVLVKPGQRVSAIEEPLRKYISEREAIPL